MPKIPESKWKKYTDPESEDHMPTMDEIESDRRNEGEIYHELTDIEEEVRNPKQDWYTGEEKKFGITDPETLWDRLAYLRIDYFDKVRDPELKKKIEDRISKVEQDIYRQFIPFIESQIDTFGWLNSPLEEYKPRRKLNFEEVLSHFGQARSALEHFKISGDKLIEFLSELDRLQEKLERYGNEPTLFTFEKIEEELHKDTVRGGYLELGYGWQDKKSAGGLDSEDARKENLLKLNLLIAKAHSLKEIADRMLNDKIKTDCEYRAKSLLNYTEQLKTDFELPRELLAIEAELRDISQRLRNKEQIDGQRLEQLDEQLKELKDKPGADLRKIEKSIKTLEKTKRLFLGEVVDEDEDDERFTPGIKGDINWAWSLLGIERNSSEDKAKKAYYKLALKYHPDRNKTEDAPDKMKKINEAYELVRRVQDYK